MARFSFILTHEIPSVGNHLEIEIDGDLGYVLRTLRTEGAIVARLVANGQPAEEIAVLSGHIVVVVPS